MNLLKLSDLIYLVKGTIDALDVVRAPRDCQCIACLHRKAKRHLVKIQELEENLQDIVRDV